MSYEVGTLTALDRLREIAAPYHLPDTGWEDLDATTLHPLWVQQRAFQVYVSGDGWAHLRGKALSHDLLVGSYGDIGSELDDGGDALIVLPEYAWPKMSVWVTARGHFSDQRHMVEINVAGEIIVPRVFGGVWVLDVWFGERYQDGDTLDFHGATWRAYQPDEGTTFVP